MKNRFLMYSKLEWCRHFERRILKDGWILTFIQKDYAEFFNPKTNEKITYKFKFEW